LSGSTIALPKAVIAKRLFHQEKAAFEGGGMGT
jgi:hypothetical protein